MEIFRRLMNLSGSSRRKTCQVVCNLAKLLIFDSMNTTAKNAGVSKEATSKAQKAVTKKPKRGSLEAVLASIRTAPKIEFVGR